MNSPDLLATCWTSAGDVVPLDGGRRDSPIPVHDRIAAAAAAGFNGFALIHDDLEIYLRDHSLRELRTVLDDFGMIHLELEFLEDWWLPEGDPGIDVARRTMLLDASEALGPHHVKVGSLIHEPGFDLDEYAAGFHRASAAFANVGTVISLEFMPFSNIATLQDGVAIAQTAGHPAGGLMIDMWHLMRGGAEQLEQVVDVPLELITGVELDDGDAEQVGDGYSDTVLRRRIPGQGDWPVHRLIEILQDKGWEGPWGVEILSESFRVRPLADSLPDAVAGTLAQFELAAATRAERTGVAL